MLYGKVGWWVLSSAEARVVGNQVSGHSAWPEIEHQRCEKNTFWRTFVRFNVLLTINLDPCKLEGRNFDRRWDIYD